MLRRTLLNGAAGLAAAAIAGPACAQFPGGGAISLVMPYPGRADHGLSAAQAVVREDSFGV